jgi:hypothetical protein
VVRTKPGSGRRNGLSHPTKKRVMEKDALPCLNFLTKKAPYKGLGAESEEKREPASDIDTAVVVSLKAVDPNRPIREADIPKCLLLTQSGHGADISAMKQTKGVREDSGIAELPRPVRDGLET